MKTTINKLKKGDNFKFNNEFYQVYKPFKKWDRAGEPYMITTSNGIFYYEELEVEILHNCLKCKNLAGCKKYHGGSTDVCNEYIKIK